MSSLYNPDNPGLEKMPLRNIPPYLTPPRDFAASGGFTYPTPGNQLLLPLAIVWACFCWPGQGASQATYSNPKPIIIPDSGPAQPFGSAILLSGMTGLVSNVSVRLNGLTHTWLQDLSVLLLGPNGYQVMLLSSAGCDSSLQNASLVFDDSATDLLPIWGDIEEGTYQPSNYTPGTSMLGVPSGVNASALAAFNGSNPNGVWTLYVMDNAADDQGAIAGGWSLLLTTTATATGASAPVPLAPAASTSTSSPTQDPAASSAPNTTRSPIQNWRTQHFTAADLADPAKAATVWGDLADPDHDGRNNLLEYALGLNPVDASDASQGINVQVLTSGTNHYQSLTFQRRKDDSSLIYVPQVSGNLQTWSATSSSLLQTSVGTLSATLDQVTYEDLTPVRPGQPRFFQLQVQAADGQIAYSDTFGATASLVRGGLNGGSQMTYFGLSVVQPVMAAGTVTALGVSTLTDAQANWPSNLLNASSGTYYAEFDSGACVDIVSANAGSQNLSLPGDVRPYVSLGSIYRIRRHALLGDIFGPNNETGLAAGDSAATADVIQLRNNQSQTTQLYYYSNASGSNGWYRADYSLASNTPIYPEQGIAVNRKAAGDVVVYVDGVVKQGPTLAPICTGLNLVGTLKAARLLTLSELNLYTGDPTTGLAPGSSPAAADDIMVPTPFGTTMYFYNNVPGNEGWWNGSYQPADGVQIAPGTVLYIIRKSPNPAFQWIIPAE